jgi:hypothetical protein
MILSALSRIKRERKLGVSYPSRDPKAKSTRERCIRVAAIITMTVLGAKSICVTEKHKQLGVPPTVITRTHIDELD